MQNPILKLDCDGYSVFSINAAKKIETKSETVMVNDGASCTFIIEESHDDTNLFWDIEYSVFIMEMQFEIYHGQSHSNKTNDEYFSVCKLFPLLRKNNDHPSMRPIFF